MNNSVNCLRFDLAIPISAFHWWNNKIYSKSFANDNDCLDKSLQYIVQRSTAENQTKTTQKDSDIQFGIPFITKYFFPYAYTYWNSNDKFSWIAVYILCTVVHTQKCSITWIAIPAFLFGQRMNGAGETKTFYGLWMAMVRWWTGKKRIL